MRRQNGSLGEPFAGDLFLELAGSGRLVLEREQADRLLTGLRHTTDVVRARLSVDSSDDDQYLEHALQELTKYIDALVLASQGTADSDRSEYSAVGGQLPRPRTHR